MNKLEMTETGYRVSLELRDGDLEGLACAAINETMARLREQIAVLKRNRKRKPYQQEDLDNDIAMLAHCAAVYDYYGGNLNGHQLWR